jgi:hypothetical protein
MIALPIDVQPDVRGAELLDNVELLEDEPIALEETYQLRRGFVRAQRAQRDERRWRVAAYRARRMGGAEMHFNVLERPANLLLSAIDAVPDAVSGATQPSRPRRPAETTSAAEPNVVTITADSNDAVQSEEV